MLLHIVFFAIYIVNLLALDALFLQNRENTSLTPGRAFEITGIATVLTGFFSQVFLLVIIRKQISCLRKVVEFEEADREQRLESNQPKISLSSSSDYFSNQQKNPDGTFNSNQSAFSNTASQRLYAEMAKSGLLDDDFRERDTILIQDADLNMFN